MKPSGRAGLRERKPATLLSLISSFQWYSRASCLEQGSSYLARKAELIKYEKRMQEKLARHEHMPDWWDDLVENVLSAFSKVDLLPQHLNHNGA